MLEDAIEKIFPGCISSQEDSLVRISQRQALLASVEWDWQELAQDSGLRCYESLTRSDLIGCWLRTYLMRVSSLRSGYLLTWRELVIPASTRSCWELGPREPATVANGFLFAATPTRHMPLNKEWDAQMFRRLSSGRLRKFRKGLVQNASGSMNWSQEMMSRALTPTPELCESFMGFPTGWTDLDASVTR